MAYYDKLANSVRMNQLSETEARELFLKRNNEAELEYNVVMHKLEKQRQESVSNRNTRMSIGRQAMDPRSPLAW